MNIILDVLPEDMPKLASLEINGRLVFGYGEDRELITGSIWVRKGELWIGTPDMPFDKNATINLTGDYDEGHWSVTSTIDTGNKNFVVTGGAYLYGIQRPVVRTRLMQTSRAK
jgi:hypothetical protein